MRILLRGNVRFLRQTWLSYYCCSRGRHRAQQNDQPSALQTSQKENNNRIPFTLTFHPHNQAVKSIILKKFKLLRNDPYTGRISSQPVLFHSNATKTIGNFLVRSAFQTSDQPRTFKCARARCKTCLFIHWENIETQAISVSFHLYLSQCYLLHILHSLQKLLHRRDRETIRRTIPRAPSRRRELRQKRI